MSILSIASKIPGARFLVLEALKVAVADKRDPDETILDGEGRPYMHRWWLRRDDEKGNWYLHQMVRPDGVKHLHNHPWDFETWVLQGGYLDGSWDPHGDTAGGDYTEQGVEPDPVKAGGTRFRPSAHLHRILALVDPTWTLVRTGPRKPNGWGFWVPDRGLVPHHQYLAENAGRGQS